MADIAHQLRAIKGTTFASDEERRLALAEARALVNRLETPWETAYGLSWTYPAQMACLRIALQLGLFEKWTQAGGQPKSEDELAGMVKCDRWLFSRIICHLAAIHMLQTIEPGVFGLTAFTSALADPGMASTIDIFFEINGPSAINLPSYVASIDYENPTDPIQGNLAQCLGKSLWELTGSSPKLELMMGRVMATYGANRAHLYDLYPATKLLEREHDDGVLLVDCGGSVGHDIAALAKKHPQRPGKLVLQDRPSVLDNAKDLDPSIEKIQYDFFTPQVVKDAAIYYFHLILHNWSDADCMKILGNQRLAMKKGYSKLLIHEVILDVRRPDPSRTSTDITMMQVVSSGGRTAQQWTKLLEDCGFKINHIYDQPLAAESVIEAELV